MLPRDDRYYIAEIVCRQVLACWTGYANYQDFFLADKGGSAAAPGKGPAAPSKRREQVRQAQRYRIIPLDYPIFYPLTSLIVVIFSNAFCHRTHRQRTQNYIKTLESEVVRLRGSESSLMQERDAFKAQVGILKTHLLLLNIPLPPGIGDSLPEPSPTFDWNESEMASISYRMDESSHQRLHVDWMSPSIPKASNTTQSVDGADQVSNATPLPQSLGVGTISPNSPDGNVF